MVMLVLQLVFVLGDEVCFGSGIYSPKYATGGLGGHFAIYGDMEHSSLATSMHDYRAWR